MIGWSNRSRDPPSNSWTLLWRHNSESLAAVSLNRLQFGDDVTPAEQIIRARRRLLLPAMPLVFRSGGNWSRRRSCLCPNGADYQRGKDPLEQFMVRFDSWRAVSAGNRVDRNLATKSTHGGRVIWQAVTRVKLEQASKAAMWTPTAARSRKALPAVRLAHSLRFSGRCPAAAAMSLTLSSIWVAAGNRSRAAVFPTIRRPFRSKSRRCNWFSSSASAWLVAAWEGRCALPPR